MITRERLSYVLIGIGLLQPVGLVLGSRLVRGLGAATAASPLPLVFSQFRGLETFAADFNLDLVFVTGERLSLPITPGLYSQLAGPYNRRNTYGAVISYGPAFTEPAEQALVQSVLGFGFCNQGPLARELGAPKEVAEATIHVRSKTYGRNESWDLNVKCPKAGDGK